MLHALSGIDHALVINGTADDADIIEPGHTRALAANVPIAAELIASKPLHVADHALVVVAVQRACR